MEDSVQIVKCRDDKEPVLLLRRTEDSGMEVFEPAAGVSAPWITEGKVAPGKLRQRIEPWLTALFQSEHLSLLVGSGLSHAMARLASGTVLPGMKQVTFTRYGSDINEEAKRLSAEANRGGGNLEDQIRVANELLRGLEILGLGNKEFADSAKALREELNQALADFASSILKGEAIVLSSKAEQLESAFNYLVSFLMSFASRTGTRDRLHMFTTNYDRFLEAGAEVAGLRLIDRFVGLLMPIFRSSRMDVDLHYNPPGMRGEPRYLEGVARFTKLHGSVDWVSNRSSIVRIGLPFGAQYLDPYLSAPGLGNADSMQLMIYPNAAKDRETAAYPYVELFRDFAAATCRPNSTLVCFGYSFGDEHINRVIEDMLTIPSTHLVVISYSDPLDRIMQTYQRLGRPAQITLLLGDHLGDLVPLVDNYLPKPAIDRTTFRMSELLKSRWAADREKGSDTRATDGTDGGESDGQ